MLSAAQFRRVKSSACADVRAIGVKSIMARVSVGLLPHILRSAMARLFITAIIVLLRHIMSLSVVVILTTMMTGITVIIAGITGMEIIVRRHHLLHIGDLTGRTARLRACARHLSDRDRGCRPRLLMAVQVGITPVADREATFRQVGLVVAPVDQASRRLLMVDPVVVFPISNLVGVDRQLHRLLMAEASPISDPAGAHLVAGSGKIFPISNARFIRYVDYTGRFGDKRPVLLATGFLPADFWRPDFPCGALFTLMSNTLALIVIQHPIDLENTCFDHLT